MTSKQHLILLSLVLCILSMAIFFYKIFVLQIPFTGQEPSDLWTSKHQVLVMIPMGALVILILRSFVGLETFGTFMPVLIALAFRETQLLFGIALFCGILMAGLTVRFYLEHLKLLLIPRLSAVLSTVILLWIGLSVIMHDLGSTYSLSVPLFPIVILTMTIERMSIVWEERSPLEALKQSLGSLFAAILCYMAMTIPALENLMFAFPELILLTIVLMLWIGRYHGYRLSELLRFRDMAPDHD